MPTIHFELLGNFRIRYNNEPPTELQKGRLQLLLVFLALNRHRTHPRQQLAFHFWPDSTEAQAFANLRKQLLYLRRRLPMVAQLLHIDAQVVGWHPTTRFEVDVEHFETALTAASMAQGEAAVHALQQAINLYQGDLLPDVYEDWLAPLREALAAKFDQALAQLLVLHEGQRDYPAAIAVAQRLLHRDPLHEPTYRCMIRLYALQGNRAAALAVYRCCVARLQQELQVEPGIELQQAYERLLQHQIPAASDNDTPATQNRPPFVGRQLEWRHLQSTLRAVERGPAHLLMLTGEAGIGKTRLAEELLEWAQQQGFLTGRAHAYAAERQLAYAPIAEWLRTPTLNAGLKRLDQHWRIDVARLLPELGDTDEAPRLPEYGASWQRHRLFEALARAFLVNQQPTLLVLDDLQWCDQESLAWLHFFLRFAPDARMLLVATVRLGDVSLQHPLVALLLALRQTSQLTELELTALDFEDTRQLAQRMSGRPLDADSARRLYRETEGHPLYIVETMRARQHDVESLSSPSRPSEPSALAHNTVSLPPRIHTVIDTRLAQLSPAARKVADLAAVVGREFSFAILAHALDDAEEELVQGLDELSQRQIIRERDSESYDFGHDKLREAIYAKLTNARRRILHRRIARALEFHDAAMRSDNSSHIAVHLDKGDLPVEAVPAYARAARAALRVHAHVAACEFYERDLALIDELPRDEYWMRQELDLLLAFGSVLVTIHGYGFKKVREVYLRAQELTEVLDETAQAAIMRALALFSLSHRDIVHAQQQGEQLCALAATMRGQSSTAYYVEGHYTLGVAAFWRGDFAKSKAYLEQALSQYDMQWHAAHTAVFTQDPGVVCRLRLGLTLWYLGYPDQAQRHGSEALVLARTLAHPFSLAYALTFGAWLYTACRIDETAHTLADESVAYCERYELDNFLPLAQMLLGYQAAKAGQMNEGIDLIRAGMHTQYSTGQEMNRTLALALLAELCAQNDDLTQALALLDEALASIEVHQDDWIAAELHRLKGDVLRQRGISGVEVEAHYQQALTVARSQAARSFELRAAMSLADLWQRQGKRVQAYSLLNQVYADFSEGFQTVDLQAAKSQLTRLL